jgi:hypothetical protein
VSLSVYLFAASLNSGDFLIVRINAHIIAEDLIKAHARLPCIWISAGPIDRVKTRGARCAQGKVLTARLGLISARFEMVCALC